MFAVAIMNSIRTTTSESSVTCTNVTPVDVHIIIAIGAILLMEKAQTMHHFVDYGSNFHRTSRRLQVDFLSTWKIQSIKQIEIDRNCAIDYRLIADRMPNLLVCRQLGQHLTNNQLVHLWMKCNRVRMFLVWSERMCDVRIRWLHARLSPLNLRLLLQ